MQLPNFNDLLAYENPDVVRQFCREHPDYTLEQARQIFADLLAWLWLSEQRLHRQLQSHMIAPLHVLDQMWHVFILHTRSYTDFCQQYFQRYLHHEVEHEGGDNNNIIATDQLTEYLNDCHDLLGEEWLARNFLG